jgi:hypothetical protein
MPEDSYRFEALVRELLLQGARSAGHEVVSRLFHRSPLDWVTLVAERFRERHPPTFIEDDCA